MKSSKEARRIAKKLYNASFADGVLDLATVRTVVRRVGERKPRGYLAILGAYWLLVRLEMERNRALVESAEALDEPTSARIAAELRKKYGEQLSIEFAVDPALLGGIKIRVGSDVWDGSVKDRLARLEEKFK